MRTLLDVPELSMMDNRPFFTASVSYVISLSGSFSLYQRCQEDAEVYLVIEQTAPKRNGLRVHSRVCRNIDFFLEIDR